MYAPTSTLQEICPFYTDRRFSTEEFASYASSNPDLRIEHEADGRIKVMGPVGGKSGNRENQVNGPLWLYEQSHPGKSFGGSTGFSLPDGSTKSPDAAFVSDLKLGELSDEQQNGFLALVPEFIVEVRSATDSLASLQSKMRDTWIANGVRLAWLVDVDADRLWIYRADHSVELVSPLDRVITGEDVLPDFRFDLRLLS